ncbi:translocation/assembly module TamB domain-containing protein [Nemorincola caseinilytica]|uniref:Translocation/assembly module TamB domain-containing protein n=1 Tax=Nemorincola caseinilytica TaxID=2054315 RepID=A0ABP8NS37_9BACT
MLGTIMLLLLTAVLLINYSPIQSYLAKRAAAILSERLKTKVEVGNVRIGLLNSLLIQKVSLQDRSQDTILYAGEIQVRITDWFIFKDKPVLHYIGLQDAYVHLYRDSAIWNYAFIEDAFSTPGATKQAKQSRPFEFDLQKAELTNVRIHMDDAWIGEDMHYDVGYLLADANGIDFHKKLIDIDEIAVRNTGILVYEYTGLRPKHLKPKRGFDTTAFNPGNWGLKVSELGLQGCYFLFSSSDDIPDPGVFDETHIDVKNIDIDITGVNVVGDTITGNINDLHAEERCGLIIKKMKSRVSVSPVASICRDLYLETNNSVLKDYYAMHYRHFPDFNHYIDSVGMVAHMKEARVDKKDVMFFAPQLKDFPDMQVTLNGKGRGTVANLSVSDLRVSDGHVELKGDLAMQGLPDIYTTLITYTNGEIVTTGKGILHFAPGLKDNPNLALDSLSYAAFKGMYEGYIENFRVNGVFKTNLGDAVTDVKMYIPGFSADSATYSGSISTSKLMLGKLIRQPLIGDITVNEQISGHSFNPDLMQMRLDGVIKDMEVNRYRYHNIITQGTLAKKQFDGKLLVDDPNLALDFDGHLDYSGEQVRINAMAHLLASNFKALNITSDNVTVSADFDLNWTGSNIDNFNGYAKLFNIDLRRNEHLLAIDSVYALSSGDSMNRTLSINSDAFMAEIKGNYRLSDLPASVQYYLSRYVPNYIPAPDKYAPGQVFDFKVTTRGVDSIFAVTIPDIRGFDNAVVKGSFNTASGKLTLDADVPYGSIGAFEMSGITVEGVGDLNNIALNTTVDLVAVADSALKGAMSLTTTVGRDTISFTLATISPDKESSASVYGQIVARHDTLTLTALPSEFYLSKAKWMVAGGSRVVYTDKYLSVKDVLMSSGIQRIAVSTTEGNNGTLLLNIHDLDVAQLGNMAGMAGYQPEGRIDAVVTVNDMFGKMLVNANVKATGVKFGADTIGALSVIGQYDAGRKLITVDPQTGIFRDHAAISVSGTVSLDSATRQVIDGSVRFRDARVAWASPFLVGLMSELRGNVNGQVNVTGTVSAPKIEGKLALSDAGLRFDYMGCSYAIPSASVSVDNKRISLDDVTLYDVYRNTAKLSGYFSHDLFSDMRMRLTVTTPKFEVMNLTHAQNELFYGKLIAGMDSFTIRGPFNNVRLNLYGGEPAGKSTIYIPASTGNYTGGYSYVSFKTYGEDQEPAKRKVKDKISINLDANMNRLAEMHIVMDPATNDEIVTTGTGNIQIEIPPNNDMRMTGLYTISEGTYTLTFPQLAISRLFRLVPGSSISFNGPFSETELAVDATYTTKARLYDLLTELDKSALAGNDGELRDAQTPQFVNVMLHMRGPIYNSALSFDIDLDNNHSKNTYAGRTLMLINSDDRRKFDQVASLLLIGAFIPNDGGPGGANAISGTVNNVSQMLSNTASSGLTQIVNRLLGNRNLNVAVKYTNYNLNDASAANVNMNQLKLGVTKNYFNDRLLVSLGSTSDWGKPSTTSTTTNFNFAGDFRLQYVLSGNSGLRLNAFSTSDYDIVRNGNIQRVGAGISWRRSFDNLGEFFSGPKYTQRQKEKKTKRDSTEAVMRAMGAQEIKK